MTNKQALPVIGKRYKPKQDTLRNTYEYEYKVIYITSKRVVLEIIKSHFNTHLGNVKDYDLYWIEKHLEEIPNQEPKPVVKKSFTTEKVQEALEGLKYIIENRYSFKPEFYIDYIRNSSVKLVDALEEQKEEKVSNSTPFKPSSKPSKESLADSNLQETPLSSRVEQASKSIWKPISELPIEFEDCIIRFNNNWKQPIMVTDLDGEFCTLAHKVEIEKDRIKDWCYFGDFINHQENLKERITKLERNNAK